MSTPPEPRRSAGDSKKVTSASSIVTRNGARKAKIQTRAVSAGAKPSASVVAAKKRAQQKKRTNVDTVLRDPYQVAMDSKKIVKGSTGFVTEPRMAEHRCLWDDNYPECPERLISVINRCNELNLIEQCVQFPPRAATKEELAMLHSPLVYQMLQTTHQNQDIAYLEELSSRYDAVYIHPSTHELALLAAGSTIDMVDRIIDQEVQNGAAFVRPPGHHAMRAEPCGYCFYNNVALAAKHAIDNRGLKRILIVDWDVHHGQATQQMFYDDPRVVYFSIHRYEHGAFWPNLRHSDFHYTGAGAARGHTFNVPLNRTGMGDDEYLAVWHELLLPMAFEYQPELILISAGYDAAVGCPEGEMRVTPACYASLLHALMGVCARVCVVLEGGYCLPSLAEGAALTLRTLRGHAPPALAPAHDDETSRECRASIRESILNCIYAHRGRWRCYTQPAYVTRGPPNVCDGRKEKHAVAVRWEGDEARPDAFATRDCYPLQDDDTKRMIQERLNHLRLVTDLTLPEHAVGYIYDEAMLKHQNICEPDHVECPERILRVHERHRDFGLLERVHVMRGRRADDAQILAVHSRGHLDRLKQLSTTKLRDLRDLTEQYDSVYFHPDSLESAAVAVGCVIQGVDAILSHAVGAAVCVVRPPGHHADGGAPSGFCLLNNAAAGAAHALARGLQRVLLVDWDVHHGNGTQRITYEDDRILYVSIHRYDHGAFFPHSLEAGADAVGSGRGEGYNINIPWNKRGMGDAEYQLAMTRVVLPVARAFRPQLCIVSAGFDACVGDPLGGCTVSPECYGRMTHLLRGVAGGRVLLCLEGGYNVTSVAYSMVMCTKALLGDPIYVPYDAAITPCNSAIDSIREVIDYHKKYWECLRFNVALPAEDDAIDPPLPSRGLQNNVESSKVNLEEQLANLSIGAKCADGVHCGTDDEDKGLEKKNDSLEKEGNSSKAETSQNHGQCSSAQGGSSKKEESNSNLEPSSGGQGGEKQTLVDYLAENMQSLVDGEMFAVIPQPWCPHLEGLYAIPGDVKFEQGTKCIECDEVVENWVCLNCYITACGRSVNGHMQAHFARTAHPLALSLLDLSAWCSACDAYVDHPLLHDAKNNAHVCKFGEDMPWCYRSDTLHMD